MARALAVGYGARLGMIERIPDSPDRDRVECRAAGTPHPE
jgi:hypothetical protein